MVFFCLSKLLFSGFLQFKGNFVGGQNDSKYYDWAPYLQIDKISVIPSLLIPSLE